ncbi:MAG: methyltransferase domain-containing protein [Candidatus Beckwithbacteria bacterium]|nr:methyltransferase domain-containing protein [Patescibacteria group bacterium]
MKIGSINYNHHHYDVIYNQNTHIASLKPLPTSSQLNKYYQQFQSANFNQTKERQRLQVIEKFKSKGRILDIGSGKGYFLHLAKKRNWKCTGIEISKKACQYANNHYQVNCKSGTLETTKLKTNYFNVITFYASLEHLQFPEKALKISHKLLKEDGLLVVRVPNIRSFEYCLHKYFKLPYHGFMFEHLHYFTPKGLKKMLKKSGFKTIKITSRHFAPPEKLTKHPYWLTINLVKRFFEYTNFGGNLCFGNVLYLYAKKF